LALKAISLHISAAAFPLQSPVKYIAKYTGPDLMGANWAVAQGPPQLRGVHKKNGKKYYLTNIKILFETDNLE